MAELPARDFLYLPTVTASSTYSGLPASNVLDASRTTRWGPTDPPAGNFPQWLQFDLTQPEVCTGAFIAANTAINSRRIAEIAIDGSNDGSNFTRIATLPGLADGWVRYKPRLLTWTNTTPYTSYRVVITASTGEVYVEVYDVVLLGSAATVGALPTEAGSAAAVSTVTAFTQYPGSYSPSNLVDGNTGTQWFPTDPPQGYFPQWVRFQMASSVTCTAVDITPSSSGGSFANRQVAELAIQGSDDGQRWETLRWVNGLGGGWTVGVARRFYFPNSTPYTNYRLVLVDNTGESYTGWSEVSWLQAAAPSISTGSGSGTTTWTGVATGRRNRLGSGSGTTTWTGTASGAQPSAPSSGSGSGNTTWTGTASGVSAKTGTGSGLTTWTGIATGSNAEAPTYPELGFTSRRTLGATLREQQSVQSDQPTLTFTSRRELGGRALLRPIPPPLGVIVEWPIRRQAHKMPALTAANQRYSPGDYPIEYGITGRTHVFVDGVDVTYLRGTPADFEDFSDAGSFGSLDARVAMPQFRPWDEPGVGDFAPFNMDRDPACEIVLVREDGSIDHLWEGSLAQDEDNSGEGREEYTFRAEGLFMQAANEPHEPPLFMEPRDRGHIIADVLNSVTHRRWSPIPRFTTGLTTTYRGTSGQSKWQYVQDVMAHAIDDDLRTLTLRRVAPYTYRMRWNAQPSPSSVDYTVTKGAPGVEVALRVDQSTRRDAIYGRGVDPDGGLWGNWFFPFLEKLVPPRYPYDNTSRNIEVGDTDADTDTGNGVTLLRRRLRELGRPVAVTDTFTADLEDDIRAIQRMRGITVDGSLGPQTWAATFDPGPVVPDLTAVRRPLATLPSVEPYLYTASGAIAGPNPGNDPKKIRHAMPEVDFGSGIRKRDAAKIARRLLDRDATPAHVGTITLLTDPWEAGSSRFDIRVGDNVQVLGHRGDVVVQVVDRAVNGLAVTLTVDSKGRDTLAVEALLERDRDAWRDPAYRPGSKHDTASLNTSEVVPYESESKAGYFPRVAVNGNTGLWTVLPIFVSQVGVAKIAMDTDSPRAEIVTALFQKPITANQLAAHIPDPLVSAEGWYDAIDTLEDRYGLLDIFGTPESPGGYWPRQKADGRGLTGRQRDSSGALYSSRYGGVVWVAVFTSRSCWVSGRIYPAGVTR